MSDKIKVWCEKCSGRGTIRELDKGSDGDYLILSPCPKCHGVKFILLDPMELGVVKELREQVDSLTAVLEQVVDVLDENDGYNAACILIDMIEEFNGVGVEDESNN